MLLLNIYIFIFLRKLPFLFSFFCVIQTRSRGTRLNIIIVAEGALDRHGKAITSSYVKDVSTCVKKNKGKPEAWRPN